MIDDFERCYRAVASRDARFDGWIVVGVTSTRIYCRPSCPARTPMRANCRFYSSAAAAQAAGFRACRRCRPDASPGSPEWNTRADVVGRAVRLIADGVVDREGVHGLATRLGYSSRQLHRQLVAEVGAGPIALARAQRAQTARVLIETGDLPFAQIAFGAGFASIRQFNDTVRAVFACTPTQLRRSSRHHGTATPGSITLRLPYRAPFESESLWAYLAARAVDRVEQSSGAVYRRALRLPRGSATVRLTPAAEWVAAELRLTDLRDLTTAVTRVRRLLDLDADPLAVISALEPDELLGPYVRKAPGRRVPGGVDGAEIAVRAVLGQQVSVRAARNLAARLVTAVDDHVAVADGALTNLFPTPDAIAGLPDSALPMPAARRHALRTLCAALADGDVVLDAGAPRDDVEARLRRLPGIGPWTASYIVMRALGHPDVYLPTDAGVRQAMERLGGPTEPHAIAAHAERWRPWRSYALLHTWAAIPAIPTEPSRKGQR